jgi:hypothetical protein
MHPDLRGIYPCTRSLFTLKPFRQKFACFGFFVDFYQPNSTFRTESLKCRWLKNLTKRLGFVCALRGLQKVAHRSYDVRCFLLELYRRR